MHQQNIDRAKRADAAMCEHARLEREQTCEGMEPLSVVNMLADILHWCIVEDEDFDHALEMARGNFEHEQANPEG